MISKPTSVNQIKLTEFNRISFRYTKVSVNIKHQCAKHTTKSEAYIKLQTISSKFWVRWYEIDLIVM